MATDVGKRIDALEKVIAEKCPDCLGRYCIIEVQTEAEAEQISSHCPKCGRRRVVKILIGVSMEDL